MTELKGNVFLYLGDKDVSKVSGIWKALHISIYIAIALNSFITAMAAGNMFQTFKYNCILFCTDIEFETRVETTTALPNNIDNNNIISSTLSDLNELDLINDTLTSTELPTNVDVPQKMVNNNNETILFKNQTHVFKSEGKSVAIVQAKIDLRKSTFPSSFRCNFVLGIALITFIFSTFCTAIMAMCSKGGKGRNNTLNRPQNLIYPILVTSILLGLLNLVAALLVKNGMKAFCANFELFSGEQGCTSLINRFTLHERQTNFYLPYMVLSHTFNLTVIFFAFQVIVTFLRVIYAVDYQLYEMEVTGNEEEHAFDVEDGHIVMEKKL